MEFNNLLEETLEAWEDARLGVVQELENIPEKHFDYRPSPDVKSVSELAIHILEVSLLMTAELTAEDTNLQRAPWPELLQTHANAAYRLKGRSEILKFMRSSLKDGIEKFQKAGELHMLQRIRRFDGKWGTRMAWLNHGIAQEMYHRGQLTTYARMLGIKPALTKIIEGDAG